LPQLWQRFKKKLDKNGRKNTLWDDDKKVAAI
jgi:hypothetical protein